MGWDTELHTPGRIVGGEDAPEGLTMAEAYVWTRIKQGFPVSRQDQDVIDDLGRRNLLPARPTYSRVAATHPAVQGRRVMALPDPSEIERLREELEAAEAELRRVNERRGDMDPRIAYFGPMHGESVRRLQVTTEADGDILSVAEQEHHKGQRLLWLEVMRIRGSYGSHDLCSLYLTPAEAEELRDLLTAYVEANRVA